MRRSSVCALSGLLSLLLTTGAVRADTPAPAVKLKHGAHCQAQKENAFEGETHRCYFSPRKFGERNFTTRNGRAMYVISELGPDCEEVEILGDGPSDLLAADGSALVQVTVHCTE